MPENKKTQGVIPLRKVPQITMQMVEKNVDNFDVFPVTYVERVTAENALLERVVNHFLTNKETKQSSIDKVVECLGTEMFKKCADGGYIWKGLR